MTKAGRIIRFETVSSVLIGAAVALFAFFAWKSPEAQFPPEYWEDISIAAGIRPPLRDCPLLWHRFVGFLILHFGFHRALDFISALGPVALGLLVSLVAHSFFRYLPANIIRLIPRSAKARCLAAAVALQGAALFAFSEPVRMASRIFTPDLFLLVLLTVTMFSILELIATSRLAYAFPIGIFSGILAAEFPLGFLPPLILALVFRFRIWAAPGSEVPPIAHPLMQAIAVRRIAVSFAVSWLGVVLCDGNFYTLAYGRSEDATFITLAAEHVFGRLSMLCEGWTLRGMAMALALVAIPLSYALTQFRRSSDTEILLSARSSIWYALSGIAAFLQLCGLSILHFWNWGVPVYWQLICMLASALTMVLSIGVFVADVYFRNNRRLAARFFPDAFEDGLLDERLNRSLRFSKEVLRPALILELIAVSVLTIPFCFDRDVARKASLVNEAARLTVAECAGVKQIFTDGALDAALELTAFAGGSSLKTLSLMSGNSMRDTLLRVRGETNAEDRAILKLGAENALRSWLRSDSSRMAESAVQIGFELWRGDRRPMPECGGFLARTAGLDREAAEVWAARAREYAERLLELSDRSGGGGSSSRLVDSLLGFIKWRLSRLCRLRADAAIRRGDDKAAELEHALADRLDGSNKAWLLLRNRMDWRDLRGSGRANFTPREGLRFGLKRADFRLAKSYARPIIESDPGDLQANFALGMSFFTERQYGQAERHLRRCLERAPDEPAVLNNLAIVLLRLDRLSEAEKFAKLALEKLPDSSEIKTTLRHVREAQEKQRTDKP